VHGFGLAACATGQTPQKRLYRRHFQPYGTVSNREFRIATAGNRGSLRPDRTRKQAAAQPQ